MLRTWEAYIWISYGDLTIYQTIAAVCLACIYENMYYDQLKEKFQKQIDDYVKDKLLSTDLESKVRVTVTITSLVSGPLDVGNKIVPKEFIFQDRIF